MIKKKAECKAISIRIPMATYNRLTEMAKINDRSVSKQINSIVKIVILLEEHHPEIYSRIIPCLKSFEL